jgi:Uma2 family endonuclease
VESEKVKSTTAVVNTADQSVVLRGVQWETYERLLADHEESRGTRLNYDCGTLEIMAPSSKHKNLKETLSLLFQLLATEMGIDVLAAGSTTFRRQDVRKGFEPDACFYVRDVASLRAKERIDLSVDPPPDLVIEIEVTNAAVDKLSLFSTAGVPEVWLYVENRVEILRLLSHSYVKNFDSSILPGVTSDTLTQFGRTSSEMPSPLWINSVRQWRPKR